MNKTYNCKIYISEERKKVIDKLLNIEDLENSDIGYRNDFENIVVYKFEDGALLYIDLCSGDNNYFLQYQLYDKNKNVIEEDCMFDLEELEEIENFENENKYIINFNIGDGENE